MFQICGDVEEVDFTIQNVYKITYGDDNATFEPLNLWTRERLRYLKTRRWQNEYDAGEGYLILLLFIDTCVMVLIVSNFCNISISPGIPIASPFCKGG